MYMVNLLEQKTTMNFAQGTLKNNPYISPYINQKVFINGEDNQASTNLPNMAVHYEFSYNQVEGGYENIISETKPKLFFYNGSATNIQDESANAITIYFHHQDKNSFCKLHLILFKLTPYVVLII